MDQPSFFSKLQWLPLPLVPTMLGFATLGNLWSGAGFEGVRNLTFAIALIVWLLYAGKLLFHGRVFLKEYGGTIPSSLYSAFCMLAMSLSAWLAQWFFEPARVVYIAAIALHALHIVVFTYRHVLRGVNMDQFVPTWFVTYVGITVSTVVGGVFDFPVIPVIMVYYGIAIYVVLTLLLIVRMRSRPVPEVALHTRAIMVAPCSLCIVSYLNVMADPNVYVVGALYAVILIKLVYVFMKIPLFFSVSFRPGFASLTFPMAIAAVASFSMADYLFSQGHEGLGGLVTQLAGLQMYLTTAVVGYVLFNFAKMGIKALRPARNA